MLVADGTADLFVKDVVVRDWDLAPVAVILNELNGLLFHSDGNDYLFSDSFEKRMGFIVARDKRLSNEMISYLASNIF